MALSELIKGPPEEPPSDGTDEGKASKAITTWWEGTKSAYWMYHGAVWQALLMYVGEMYLNIDNGRRVITQQPSNPGQDWVPRPRINRFAPSIDAIASNFQNIPEIEAVACPVDDMDRMDVADFANELARHFIKTAGLRTDFKSEEDKVSLAGQWFALAGMFGTNVYSVPQKIGEKPVLSEQPAFGVTCPVCDTFETSQEPEPPQVCAACGNPVEISETSVMAEQPDEMGNPMMEDIIEKKVVCEIDEPLAYYPSPGAKSNTDASFLIKARRMSVNSIWSRWGFTADPDNEYPDGWNTYQENALKYFYQGFQSTNSIGKDFAMVLEVYVEPGKNREFPEGFYAVYCNGKVQTLTPWAQSDFNDYPVTKVDSKPMPTLYFPRSVSFDLCAVQDLACKMASAIVLHCMTGAAEPILVEDGTVTTPITGRGDIIIKYTRQNSFSEKPSRLEHENLDQGAYEFYNSLMADLDKISQATPAFKGEQPGSVKAGVAINELGSRSDFMFGGPNKNWNAGWKETVRKAVKLMQRDYTPAQLIAIAGEDRIDSLDRFRNADLDKEIEWMTTKSGLPRTREERRAEMFDMFDRGLLDVNDPDVKTRMFELFGDTGISAGFNEDARRARWENSSMTAMGPPMFLVDVDDHAVHLSIHGQDIKSAKFLRYPPEVQALKLQHYQQHKAVIVMEQAAAAQAAAPAKPAPEKEPVQ